jgi:FAD/FMN-containing dehydrogenase
MADTASFSLKAQLAQIVGPDFVQDDEKLRALMSEDIWDRGGMASLVVAPGDLDEASRAVAVAARNGAAILPRGGGMSYTGGYAAKEPGGVVFDMRRMNTIVSIDETNMTVTVQAGATWAALHEALKPRGLRTPFWGPLSGISSTIGGGLSQNNAFFGAGQYGTTAESVVSITVVLADGTVLRTGTAARAGGAPFYRFDGPDAAGLFMGDCGAFGLKAEATFRLMRAPEHEGWASFSFTQPEPCARAMADVARAGLACEAFGFDPALARLRLKRASLLADAGALAKVVTSQKSVLAGLKEGAKMALAGRSFLDEGDYSLHVVAEGRSKAGVEHDLAAIRAIVKTHGGEEVENTIPKVIRANPFTPLNNVLGPEGERWVPIHGIVRLGDAAACWSALDAAFAARRAALDAIGATTGYLITTLSTNAFLIEPVFFWPEERFALHEATVEPHYLAKLPKLPQNPAATDIIVAMRQDILDVFQRFGAAHFQLGRTYPFAQTRAPEALATLRAFKRAVDPENRMNPGVLGLS